MIRVHYNPILEITLAVIAVAGGVVKLWDHFEEARRKHYEADLKEILAGVAKDEAETSRAKGELDREIIQMQRKFIADTDNREIPVTRGGDRMLAGSGRALLQLERAEVITHRQERRKKKKRGNH